MEWQQVALFVLVGFVAQAIDGALGMAYGVSSTSFLLSLGIPAASASASVHAAECFTTAVSGFSHWRLGNVDWALFKKLVIPGSLGAILGAYILINVPADIIKPFVTIYLLVMGGVILYKAWRYNQERKPVTTHLIPLGAIGGFFDAIGGGGWGPVVTTTLVARGNCPKKTIGSVNLTEFFVTFSQSVVFVFGLSFLEYWPIILGLLIGGVIAAPLAAYSLKLLPARALMFMVGILIVGLQIRTLLLAYVL